MAEYKREIGTAVTIGVVIAGFLAVVAISTSPSSTTSTTLALSTTTSSMAAVYQLIESNMTLRGHAATIPCSVIDDLVISTCPSVENAFLSHVELVKYGSVYYYFLQNQTGPLGYQGHNYTYDLWFTNSTVFCVSPAQSQISVCPSLPYSPEGVTISTASASTVDSSTELRLNLNISTNPTGVLNVAVNEFNTLDKANNVSKASNLPLTEKTDFFLWHGAICSNSPVGYEVIRGNYGAANYTEGTALALAVQSPVQCGGVPTPDYYIFKPLSVVATISDSSSGFWIGGLDGYFGNSCSNLVASPSSSCNISFVPFPPGAYTVVAGDEWGQIVTLHFTIQH